MPVQFGYTQSLVIGLSTVSATPNHPASPRSSSQTLLPTITAGSPEDRFLALFARLVIEDLLTEHHAGSELSASAVVTATATASSTSSFTTSKSHKRYLQ